ncbi:hypothetical protein KL933_002594 [Ogataea haglerorum]|uniref:Squalene monooxygenase n=1 Tax=Ogataea haglerorum TaxID=1937702 RepID=A0AAN6D5R3_9ASCO|nr:hypothetical protein KL951_003346 [Ogataea haglerorum]KAG7727660.1 hypothetical protein KL933_002594 [Ogataea haglerorum]KAG7787849.1 hypothetical protein KL910_003403 [Ogataea haglerorum]KAG7790178.1 hypothetical protein KL945_001716 [Ogataea haglerorum]KAG7796568.1 hypothetical protein KL929_003075 [Ogataea haglerorum]
MYDVIVVGAGVVGPCIATVMARQGRKVLIAEREWTKPNRIIGELLQPAGLKALRQLGMVGAINNIDAIQVDGYYVSYYGRHVQITYPDKSVLAEIDTEPVPGALKLGNEDKLETDSTLNMSEWDRTPTVRGVAFHHGDFLMNLRGLCLAEPNVTKLEGNVTELIREDGRVVGVKVAGKGEYRAKLVICCDGIYSKFRKELYQDKQPEIESYFVGLELEDAELPLKNHGHVILGKHAPILMYQVSPRHTRILCSYRSSQLPKQKEVLEYLRSQVLVSLPEKLKPSFEKALGAEQNVYRSMPNQYLTAKPNTVPGLIYVGDSLNMRHPLTGGGMTVGLNDAVLLCKLLADVPSDDFLDEGVMLEKMLTFHGERKPLDAVLNTLSIALYTLFAAESRYLELLQRGCFAYFELGGKCISEPVGLLSGMLQSPGMLFYHFFRVAFYSCYLNFCDRGLLQSPIALWENICTLSIAACVLLPYLIKELM